MSTKNKKVSPTGIRYSPTQKQEVVEFVTQYNSANGRGGQSAAAKKYGITQLTVSAWLKAAGAPKATKKSEKPAKSEKAVKSVKSGSKSKKGVRYSTDQKAEVVDFVNEYNSQYGRGGQSRAAKKFNLSVLTVSSWLKNAGATGYSKGTTYSKSTYAKASRATGSSAGLNSKFVSLIEVGDQLRRAESETEKLRAKYDALRASIQALL